MNDIGAFIITGGVMRATDPGCMREDSEAIFPAKNGVWLADVTQIEDKNGYLRVARLLVHHESVEPPFDIAAFEQLMKANGKPNKVGVDTALAGFFSDDNYDDELEDMDKRIGLWTPSGYGDGSYDCFILKDKIGKAVAAYLEFIKADAPVE